jgi:hypothetical protein
MTTKDKRICLRGHFDNFWEGILKGNATLAVIPIGADIHPLFGKDGYGHLRVQLATRAPVCVASSSVASPIPLPASDCAAGK